MSRRLRERRLSRAFSAREKKPVDPHPLKKFADKAYDLDLVRKSVDDAASVSAGLWLSYLFALFYIGIAAGGVTHENLLLENPVRLPFLNVELPFVAFFVLAPVLFVVSHAYTLMHFVVLAAKVGAYNTELAKQIPAPDVASASELDVAHTPDHREIRRGLRRQLPSNIFVQFLAGPLDIREGGVGFLLKAIAWISLVIGPVCLLLLIQVQFLPYHLEWVTWVQRLSLLADVVLLWFLWPAVLGGRSEIRWPRVWRHPVAAVVSLVPIALAFAVARYPGEWVDHHVGHMRWIPVAPRQAWHEAKNWPELASTWLAHPGWTSVHDFLFNGDVDDVTRRRQSFFSNTLVLPAFDGLAAAGIDDPKRLDSDGVKHSLILRGRHLKGAVLTRADLRKADLEAAELEGANLDGAQLQGAKLDRAELEGTSLVFADLRDASLQQARLPGAGLDGAQLQGANLSGAQLQGIKLGSAQLQGASLSGARLQAAVLDGAQLQGASLRLADLQGARLEDAQLHGASLEAAELQGVQFRGATLTGTSLAGASVWRTSFEGAKLTDVFGAGLKDREMSKEGFSDLEAMITKVIPESLDRHGALLRIEGLNPDIFGPETSIILVIARRQVDEAAYQEALVRELKKLACSGDENARHIAREGGRSRISDTGPLAPTLVDDILSPACPVSAALTDEDKVALRTIAKHAQADENR